MYKRTEYKVIKGRMIIAAAILAAATLISCDAKEPSESTQVTTPAEPEDNEERSDLLPGLVELGSVSDDKYNAGCGLADDTGAITSEDALMQVISNTTAAALESYAETLEEKGYTLLNKNVLDGDTYYTFGKNNRLYYLYHSSRVGETRVIEDNCSDPLSEIAYEYIKKGGEITELYQYSLNYQYADEPGYDPVKYAESGISNIGMCYIIKLADNSVIIIDSGDQVQSTAKSREGFVNFLREITATPEGEKVKVSMWCFSHAHKDHIRMAADVINEYYGDLNLVSVTHNFTTYSMSGRDHESTSLLRQAVREHYPDVLFHKLHTGESFSIADVKFEVVYTHEDATSAEAKTEISDYNSSSTVLKIMMDDKIIMMLGDISEAAESTILAMRSKKYMKSDAVQVAYHGLSNLKSLYSLINAKIALFPQSMFNMKVSNINRYNLVMKYADEEYFAHKYTYKFTVVDGGFEATALPRYDFEELPDLTVMGTVSSATYNAGCGLAEDILNGAGVTTAEDVLMKVISNTTVEALESYTQTLEEKGYTLLNKNVLDGDTYYTFGKNNRLYYLYHSSRVGETRVIEDNCSDPLSEIAYEYIKKGDETTEFYQYSLNYDLAAETGSAEYGFDPVTYTESSTINCGMCYIIKLADDSVIIIDSGHQAQSTAKSRKGFVNFLREITDTPAGKKVKVAMWYFTHAHDDHIRMAAGILNEYYYDINLVSVAHNFTTYYDDGARSNSGMTHLKSAIKSHYPDVLFHKLHTGESFPMADVKIDVVYTHEDATSTAAKSEFTNYNSSSTVIKITMDGKTIMMLGDLYTDAGEKTVAAMHSAEYLKSDAVQAAHHGFNNLTSLYPRINAKIALFPQSPGEEQKNWNNRQAYNTIMRYADKAYFAHKYTYRFTVVNGEFKAEALPRYDAQ